MVKIYQEIELLVPEGWDFIPYEDGGGYMYKIEDKAPDLESGTIVSGDGVVNLCESTSGYAKITNDDLRPFGLFDNSLTFCVRDKSKLTIHDEFSVMFKTERPNAFWRFWQRLLLGWRWENIE